MSSLDFTSIYGDPNGVGSDCSDTDNEDEVDHGDRNYEPLLVNSLSNKRKYFKLNRSNQISKRFSLNERWCEEVQSLLTRLPYVPCCKKLKCFRSANVPYLKAKIEKNRRFS